MAGDEQIAGEEDQFLLVEPPLSAVADVHQRAQQVAGRLLPPLPYQRREVVGQRLGGRRHLGRGARGGGQQRVGPAPQFLAVLPGHAEQIADHGDGQRQREGGDQVRGRAGGLHGVQQLPGDPFRAGPQLLHPALGEHSGDGLAQPGVVRRVQRHQDAFAGRVRLDPRSPLVQRPGSAEPGIAQHRPDVLVACHQPGFAAVREAHPAEGFGFAQRREERLHGQACGGLEGKVPYLPAVGGH